MVRDLWLSTVYKMPLMQVRDDARLGKLTQEVTRFERGEPDESLFEISARICSCVSIGASTPGPTFEELSAVFHDAK
jgi:hypothetical protein